MDLSFNPATVWFEPWYGRNHQGTHVSFNPATVWFELHERRKERAPQLQFQSRNGLIWTFPIVCSLFHTSTFQSRNGLIWTQYAGHAHTPDRAVSIPQRSDLNAVCWTCTQSQPRGFNPATVWFEHNTIIYYYHAMFGFNPATVWFELSLHPKITISKPAFQSRNGLIWTWLPTMWTRLWTWFQSRNGLIWTVHNLLIRRITEKVSIPQRSDLNSISAATRVGIGRVSIPQRSDLNHQSSQPVYVVCNSFNPATVWFEPRWKTARNSATKVSIPQRSDLNFFSHCTTSHDLFVSIPQRSDLNGWSSHVGNTRSRYFNPATVWFEQHTQYPGWRNFETISIPQRSDLNITCTRSLMRRGSISIPQRSDLNSIVTSLVTVSHKFQSRNGLIWTAQYASITRF